MDRYFNLVICAAFNEGRESWIPGVGKRLRELTYADTVKSTHLDNLYRYDMRRVAAMRSMGHVARWWRACEKHCVRTRAGHMRMEYLLDVGHFEELSEDKHAGCGGSILDELRGRSTFC